MHIFTYFSFFSKYHTQQKDFGYYKHLHQIINKLVVSSYIPTFGLNKKKHTVQSGTKGHDTKDVKQET